VSIFEDIRRYLPQYLSDGALGNLFNELEGFPSNIDSRMYSFVSDYKEIALQGDCFRGVRFVNLNSLGEDLSQKDITVMTITNTCDADVTGKTRVASNNVCYCPVYNLEKFCSRLLKSGTNMERVRGYSEKLREQAISNAFYLPSGPLGYEAFIFFDQINYLSAATFSERVNVASSKAFSLSDYGFYMFLVKLSIHFTRMGEAIERG
jgi:hypothetical protein